MPVPDAPTMPIDPRRTTLANPSGTPFTIAVPQSGQGLWYPTPASAQPVASEAAPAGLEKYWPKMSTEERQEAARLLAQGFPLNRIIERLQ
jgi:hypothetical protein